MDESMNEEQPEELREPAVDPDRGTSHAVLSQDEVNTLLSAYQSANRRMTRKRADGGERHVRLYDFARPDRFSREQMRALQSIHRTFAAELASALTELLSVPTRVELIGVEQQTCSEYRTAIPDRTLLAEVTLSEQSPVAVFELNSSIVGLLVDWLCGGSPDVTSQPSDLTPADLAVARKALDTFLQVYASAWPKSSTIRAQVTRVTDGGSGSEHGALPSEAVVVCSFEAQLGNTAGMMTICLPALTVESILPASPAARCADGDKNRADATSARQARSALDSVEIPCSVVLGRARISLADMTNLEVGDVIRTDRRAGLELDLVAGGRVLFRCRPGMSGNSMAVVISGVEDVDGQQLPMEHAYQEASEPSSQLRYPEDQAQPKAA